MISCSQTDEKLLNIARIAESRTRDHLTLVIDPAMGEYVGSIQDRTLTAGSHHQMLYLLGKYLRNPAVENGTYRSQKEFCGMYIASHNRNYYVKAPLEELFGLIDDLALWGMNVLSAWFSLYDFPTMEEGKWLSDRLIAILNHCRSIGVKTMLQVLANEAFPDSPKALRADWTCGHDGYIYNLNDHFHVEICPSVPGGMEKILEYRRQFLEVFKEAEPDYVCLFAYDEGGCSCGKCASWGSNGYIRTVEALIPLFREYWPRTEFVLSMWQFGTFTGNDAESIGLRKILEEGRIPECAYLLAEPQYLRYPYEHGMPRPLIGFPEISMCNTLPWGGYGANPIPGLLQKLFDADGVRQEGSLPYSEGFYEDINKVITLRYNRDGQSASDTVREYLSYEFGLTGALLDKMHEAVLDMEETLYRGFEPGHRYPVFKPEKIERIEAAVREADGALPEEVRSGKRWQMIYLRALIDGELKRNDFRRNDRVKAWFRQILDMFYLDNAGFHVKPDIVEDDEYGRVLTREELKIIAAGGKIE